MTPATSAATALERRWGPTSTWHVGAHLQRQASERPDAPYLAIGDSPLHSF
ncbi:MAG: hypothetical protein HYU55_20470, partial [Nocardioides sp.]|nr:hypothetical protein [Nocardioides sp.]